MCPLQVVTEWVPNGDVLEYVRTNALLRATKECYFRRLSVHVNPSSSGYDVARWIMSEDVNVEYLLDVFTSIDANSDSVWDVCACFMRHLYCHKLRLVVLGLKLEGLPDGHPSKPNCLFELSRLFDSVGNYAERKRLLIHALKLWRARRDDFQVAKTLTFLASTNQRLLLFREGILQAEEALKINEQLNYAEGQAQSLRQLAYLLHEDKQLDAAEEAAFRSIDLLPENAQIQVCQGHRALGDIYRSKREVEKSITHYKTALGIADFFRQHIEQFWIHHSLAELFRDQGRFDEAHAHVERAESLTGSDAYDLGRAVKLRASIWDKQGRLEEAKSEASRAVDAFEKLGAAKDAEDCRELLRSLEEKMKKPGPSSALDLDGKLWTRCHFLHPLTFHPQVGEPIDGTDNCLDLYHCTLPRIVLYLLSYHSPVTS